MITKQQLDDLYLEVERLEKAWEKNKALQLPQMVSHRLLGHFLQTFNTDTIKRLTPISQRVYIPELDQTRKTNSPLKKLDNIERVREKPAHDPKTGKFIKGHRGFPR